MLGAHACIVPSACDKAMQVLLDADLPFEVHVAREEVPRGDGGARGGVSTSNCSARRRHDLVWSLFL